MKPEKLLLPGAALAVAALIVLLPTYYVGLMTLAGTNTLVCLGLAFLLAAGCRWATPPSWAAAPTPRPSWRATMACRRRWPSCWPWPARRWPT